MIQVPEGVAFYWGDPINRAAVSVLSGSAEVPPDLRLPEVERFELASLAARRVRVEYWTFLRALWSAAWGEAVRAHLPAARLLTYGGHCVFSDEVDPLAEPSVDSAWDKKAVGGVFDVPGHGHLFTRIALIEGEREGQLQFYLWDAGESSSISDGLDLGSDWSDDGDSRRSTRAGLLPLARDGSGIDPEPFATLAHDAMSALAAAL